MKVVCLISSLQLGGAERQLSGLAAMLKSSGAVVEVLTYKDGSFYSDYLRENSVSHVFIRKKGDVRLIRDIADHLRRTGCDVLVSFLAGTNIKACLVHLLHPEFRLIVSERIFNTRCLPHDMLRFLLYRGASAVVCNNHSQEDLIRRKAPRLNTLTIPNFVDTDRFAPSDDAGAGAGSIIVTARLCRRKNPDGLVKAAGILKREGIAFTINWFGVTPHDAAALARLESLCRGEGVDDCVHFLPASDHIELEYRKASVFCLPSFYEGTSNSLAEALASGLVPVCSGVGDNSFYVRDGDNGFLFDPCDPQSIADALKRAVVLDAQSLADMGKRNRAAAEEKLGKAAFADAWCSLLGLD